MPAGGSRGSAWAGSGVGVQLWGAEGRWPGEARSWRDVVGRGRPPTASVLGLLRGADAAHALRYSLPRDTVPSAPLSPIPWRSARFVGSLSKGMAAPGARIGEPDLSLTLSTSWRGQTMG